MKEQEKVKRTIPPYVPYRTLDTFLDRIKAAVLPNRIDRSVIPSMSWVMQSQLLAALEHLNLTKDGFPTEKLSILVHSEGEERQRLLKEILISSYPFLFRDGFDLKRTTSIELRNEFEKIGVSGETTRKCMTFFLKAAKDAGINVSPHIKKIPGPRIGSGRTRRKMGDLSPIPKLSSELSESESWQSNGVPWEKMLLSKFPSFDPAWPAEVQIKWLDMFKELMELKTKKENE